MQWLSRTPNFDFVRYRRVAMVTSTTLSLLAIIAIFYPGLNYGIDFTGGILVEARFAAVPELDKIRAELSGGGFEDTQVTGSGTDVLIRLPPPEGVEGAEASAEAVAALRDRVLEVLRTEDPDVTILRADNVGGQVGAELFENAGLALLFALIMIFIYVMLRFRWKLAVGAIVATVHDVLVTTGIFAIAGWQFDLTVLGSTPSTPSGGGNRISTSAPEPVTCVSSKPPPESSARILSSSGAAEYRASTRIPPVKSRP